MTVLFLILAAITSCLAVTQETLIFSTGFERDTTFYYTSSPDLYMYAYGVDGSAAAQGKGDWTSDLVGSGVFGQFRFYYEGGTESMRNVSLVSDPMAPSNTVMRYYLPAPNVNGSKGRIQAVLRQNPDLRHFRYSVKVFMTGGFNLLNMAAQKITWLTIAEFWNDLPSKTYPFRVTLNCVKDGVAGEPLKWGAHGQVQVGSSWNNVWEHKSAVNCSTDQWQQLDVQMKEGSNVTGRINITVDGQTVYEAAEWTYHPEDPAPDGFSDINPLKLYTNGPLIEAVTMAGQPFEMFWDDWSIYHIEDVTAVPTATPTLLPTAAPSQSPTGAAKSPSAAPSTAPSMTPTSQAVRPSAAPSLSPTSGFGKTPTQGPTTEPSRSPTMTPSSVPSNSPSEVPSAMPSTLPTASPTVAAGAPTKAPTTKMPSTIGPTAIPSTAPTQLPSGAPSSAPIKAPSKSPSVSPTAAPGGPTKAPSSGAPTSGPTNTPSRTPTSAPTKAPAPGTNAPTAAPSALPSSVPTVGPTASPGTPTAAPSASPTSMPTVSPTTSPTSVGSSAPTAGPTGSPSAAPTINAAAPSASPTTSAPTVSQSVMNVTCSAAGACSCSSAPVCNCDGATTDCFCENAAVCNCNAVSGTCFGGNAGSVTSGAGVAVQCQNAMVCTGTTSSPTPAMSGARPARAPSLAMMMMMMIVVAIVVTMAANLA